jgi:putative nucleotidyltransferase with HDIG domain
MVQGVLDLQSREVVREVFPERKGFQNYLPGHLYLYPAILAQASSLLGTDAAALIRYFPASKTICFELSNGAWHELSGKRITVKEDVTGLVIHSGQICRNIQGLPGVRKERFPFINLPDNLRSMAFVPIATAEMSIQAMWVARRSGFGEGEIHQIQDLSNALGSVLWTTQQLEHPRFRQSDTVNALAGLLAVVDPPTYQHSARLVPWVEAVARSLGLKDKEVLKLRWATLLHDLGKIAIPKKILYKPGPFTPEEWVVMKRHPEIGAKILEPIKGFSAVAEIVRDHHEKFDGSGYPHGKKGEKISIHARILSVVDAYGAMTEDRVYRKTSGHDSAVAEIQRCAGTDFDPRVSAAFLRLF